MTDLGAATPRQSDFVVDGQINGQDFLAWQRAYGSSQSAIDADKNGTVDEQDLLHWRLHYGRTLPTQGDFDESGSVDGSDFLLWQRNAFEYAVYGDADGDGVVTGTDLEAWKGHFGTASMQSEGAAAVAPALAANEEMAAGTAATSFAASEDIAATRRLARDAIFAAGDFSRLFGLGGEGDVETSLRRRGRASLARRG